MSLSQQVTSLELSKRLKELGVKERSFFYWSKVARSSGTNYELIWADSGEYPSDLIGEYAAFTVGELGEIMKHTSMECVWFPEKNQWGCFGTLDGIDTFYADTEADARGCRFAYLIENKLMTI